MTRSGELFLGVNDNYLRDNKGYWSAYVGVTPAAGSSGSNNGSKKTAIVVGGLVALIAIFACALFVVRRRAAASRAAEAQPTEAELRELAAVVAGRVDGDILLSAATPRPSPHPRRRSSPSRAGRPT